MLHQPLINLGPSGSIKSYCASKVPITPRKSALAWSVGDDQPDFESVQSFSGSLTRRSGRLSAAAASRAFTAFFPKVSLAPLPDIHTGERLAHGGKHRNNMEEYINKCCSAQTNPRFYNRDLYDLLRKKVMKYFRSNGGLYQHVLFKTDLGNYCVYLYFILLYELEHFGLLSQSVHLEIVLREGC